MPGEMQTVRLCCGPVATLCCAAWPALPAAVAQHRSLVLKRWPPDEDRQPSSRKEMKACKVLQECLLTIGVESGHKLVAPAVASRHGVPRPVDDGSLWLARPGLAAAVLAHLLCPLSRQRTRQANKHGPVTLGRRAPICQLFAQCLRDVSLLAAACEHTHSRVHRLGIHAAAELGLVALEGGALHGAKAVGQHVLLDLQGTAGHATWVGSRLSWGEARPFSGILDRAVYAPCLPACRQAACWAASRSPLPARSVRDGMPPPHAGRLPCTNLAVEHAGPGAEAWAGEGIAAALCHGGVALGDGDAGGVGTQRKVALQARGRAEAARRYFGCVAWVQQRVHHVVPPPWRRRARATPPRPNTGSHGAVVLVCPTQRCVPAARCWQSCPMACCWVRWRGWHQLALAWHLKMESR